MAVADITTPIRAKLIVGSYKGWMKKGSKVLDVGCGTGIVADELAHKLKIKVVGCDIDQYLVRKIPFKKIASGSHLPFKSREFDAVMLNDVLHHTEYSIQEKLLSESLRVANKVLIFELRPTTIGKVLDFIINKIHNPKMPIPFTYRSDKEWEKLFRKNHLKFKKKKVVSPFYYPFSHISYRVKR
ncbi:class I SAM-dependent methyltransferase [Patescibacteria group bacterium]|nr:class I SAM-dependent methyltransferase [Patescibacteria group bacterium]